MGGEETWRFLSWGHSKDAGALGPPSRREASPTFSEAGRAQSTAASCQPAGPPLSARGRLLHAHRWVLVPTGSPALPCGCSQGRE